MPESPAPRAPARNAWKDARASTAGPPHLAPPSRSSAATQPACPRAAAAQSGVTANIGPTAEVSSGAAAAEQHDSLAAELGAPDAQPASGRGPSLDRRCHLRAAIHVRPKRRQPHPEKSRRPQAMPVGTAVPALKHRLGVLKVLRRRSEIYAPPLHPRVLCLDICRLRRLPNASVPLLATPARSSTSARCPDAWPSAPGPIGLPADKLPNQQYGH